MIRHGVDTGIASMGVLDLLGFKPSAKNFADKVVEAMPEGLRRGWVFDEGANMLTHPTHGEISLRNMYVEYCASRIADRAALVRKYAALASAKSAEVPQTWEEAADGVFAVVRSAYVECTIEIKRRADGKSLDQVALPFVGDLRIRLMYDFGNFMSYVSAETLAAWGRTPEAVLQRAVANLGELDSPAWLDQGNGVYQLESPQSLGESMLLLDAVVEQLPYAAHAVLMPCNRGILLAADGRSESSLEAMLDQAQRHLVESPWPMSSVMCTRAGNGWEEFAIPPSLREKARALATRHLADNYAAQKEALDALNEARGVDVFVATCSLMQSQGQWQSYCVWARGIPTLLPVTDWVAVLADVEGKVQIRVDWPVLAEICADRLQPTQEQPTRFLVTSFPDEDQWRSLQERARGKPG